MLLKHPVCEMSSLRKVFTRTLIKKLAQLNNWVEFSRNRKGKVWEFRCDGKIGGADKCYHCGHRGATDGFPSAPKNRLLKCQTGGLLAGTYIVGPFWPAKHSLPLTCLKMLFDHQYIVWGKQLGNLKPLNQTRKTAKTSGQLFVSDPFDPPTFLPSPLGHHCALSKEKFSQKGLKQN